MDDTIENLQKRIDKAIEYMEYGTEIECMVCGAKDDFNYDDLINILKNGDDDNE